MAFSGWSDEALEFWEGLEADNSRAYWQDNQERYTTCVRTPMLQLLAELEPGFGPGRTFRPHRDVRFSPDKSPYKTQLGAVVGDTGYVQVSARGLAAGTGYYAFAQDQLVRYRRALLVDVSGEHLHRLVTEACAQGLAPVAVDQLRQAPRGVPVDHPRIALLRLKGLVMWREFAVEPWLATPAARTRVEEVLTAGEPVAAWLREHVGPSQLPRGR